jgi:hypothetical protein
MCEAGRGCGACHEQIAGMLPAGPSANDNPAEGCGGSCPLASGSASG